jgi:hypothetical protein
MAVEIYRHYFYGLVMANIPNDLGGDWRIDKFVDYQHFVPPIYQSTLTQYAIDNQLNDRDCTVLSWYMSVTYSEISAIWMHQVLPISELHKADDWFEKHKDIMIFGSSKKYNRYKGRFNYLMKQFLDVYGTEPEKKLYEVIGTGTEKEMYDRALKQNLAIKECGRFSAELFNECCLFLSEAGFMNAKMSSPNSVDWDKGANLTSCMFNLLRRDDLADGYDKLGKLTDEMKTYIPLFNSELIRIRDKIWTKYPERQVDIPLFTPKLCSFRNLFKCTRYAPFHADRQLEHIRKYEEWYPELSHIWDGLFDIRSKTMPVHFLGEKNNWNGIRKERKYLWVNRGLTGVEPESNYPESTLEEFC